MENTPHDFELKLKELCLKYDAKAGYCPRRDLVGLALYKFYLHPDMDLSDYRSGNRYKEIDKEYESHLKN